MGPSRMVKVARSKDGLVERLKACGGAAPMRVSGATVALCRANALLRLVLGRPAGLKDRDRIADAMAEVVGGLKSVRAS